MSWKGSLEIAATTHPTTPKPWFDPEQLKPETTSSCRTSSTTAGRSINRLLTSPTEEGVGLFLAGLRRASDSKVGLASPPVLLRLLGLPSAFPPSAMPSAATLLPVSSVPSTSSLPSFSFAPDRKTLNSWLLQTFGQGWRERRRVVIGKRARELVRGPGYVRLQRVRAWLVCCYA